MLTPCRPKKSYKLLSGLNKMYCYTTSNRVRLTVYGAFRLCVRINFWKMKSNESQSRNRVAWVGRSHVSRRSMQNYILTYCGFRKGTFDSRGLLPGGLGGGVSLILVSLLYPSSGWQGGSIGRASDSRSKGPRFESRQEHKTKM